MLESRKRKKENTKEKPMRAYKKEEKKEQKIMTNQQERKL